MAARPLPASSKALTVLVRYLVLRDSAWFFSTLLPEYAYWIPVVIYASFMLGVTCEVRYWTDYILGTDFRLFQDMSIWDPRHH